MFATPVPPFGDLSRESFLLVTKQRGPNAGTVHPFSINLPQHRGAYPAYAGLFTSLQNKVLPIGFHFILFIHPQVLTSNPRVARQGNTRRFRPRRSCPMRSGSPSFLF